MKLEIETLADALEAAKAVERYLRERVTRLSASRSSASVFVKEAELMVQVCKELAEKVR